MRIRWLLVMAWAALPAVAFAEGWRELAHEVHEARIDAGQARARAALESVPGDAYGRAEIPAVRTLLDAPVVAIDHAQLQGVWRCRSIQVGALGVFSYPPFRCEIRLSEDGTLEFTKLTGSQRRHGQLYPTDAGAWVLLGGSSVNDDPYRSYSASSSDWDGEDIEADTVGLLEALSRKRLRILLDAEAGQFEIYELTR